MRGWRPFWRFAPPPLTQGTLGTGVRMSLLRCPKFPRCLTADAGNFDRGHSLTSLPLPLAALSSLPTASVRTGLAMTLVFHGGAVCGGAHGPRPTRAFARIAGGQGRPPLRCCVTKKSVGEGLSCPPLCQPVPGHCRGRQSGHFLEIASLLPPPATLRRFPLPRAG